MPPKKTISRPEVRKISWKHLRGDYEVNLFEQIAYDPIADQRDPSSCTGVFYEPEIPLRDRGLEKHEFYRNWIGARLERGQIDSADESYLRRSVRKCWPGIYELFLLPRDADLGGFQNNSLPDITARAAHLIGRSKLAEVMRGASFHVPEDITFTELVRSVAVSAIRMTIQRWGQYIAVLISVDWNTCHKALAHDLN